jgi:glycosyltransferase involved in cell wall biosynthesis
LPYVLRSLESQTLPKDKFEVIIVKNFKDRKTEEIIEEMNG